MFSMKRGKSSQFVITNQCFQQNGNNVTQTTQNRCSQALIFSLLDSSSTSLVMGLDLVVPSVSLRFTSLT